MKALKIILLILPVIIAVNGFYILPETQQAIITQFGNPVGNAVKDAGLHFVIPFIQKVHYFEKRILEWDGAPKQVPTLDKKFIWVDTFARWKINNPLVFFQSVKNENGAHSRLDDNISGVTKDIITQYNLIEVVRNTNRKMTIRTEYAADEGRSETQYQTEKGRSAISEQIVESAKGQLAKFGIELIDVQIKRVNYIDKVRNDVYDRMISEREKIAAGYRSAGQGKGAEILGKLQKELDTIQSEAYRQAQEIKGNADAQATAIYAKAYNKDPEFFEFLRTLQAYPETVKKKDTMIMTTDSDFYKYLKKSQ
ncbi:MAG: HflC protein [Candidatus Cloacimonadota bacterium]|nr:MAG: HflC protein [Candidatus Cloacimonadota bacterium]